MQTYANIYVWSDKISGHFTTAGINLPYTLNQGSFTFGVLSTSSWFVGMDKHLWTQGAPLMDSTTLNDGLPPSWIDHDVMAEWFVRQVSSHLTTILGRQHCNHSLGWCLEPNFKLKTHKNAKYMLKKFIKRGKGWILFWGWRESLSTIHLQCVCVCVCK